MATRTTSAKPPASTRRQPGNAAPERPNALLTTLATIAGLFTRIHLPARFRREVSAVGLILVAAISAWALTPGGADGVISAWWGRTIAAALGASAWLLPIFAAMLAVRAVRLKADGAIIMGRDYAGGALFICGVVGLLDLGSAGAEKGGTLGVGVTVLLERAIGNVGTALVLFAGGVIGVFLLANTDALTFARDVNRLLPKRRRSPVDPVLDLAARIDPVIAPPAAPIAAPERPVAPAAAPSAPAAASRRTSGEVVDLFAAGSPASQASPMLQTPPSRGRGGAAAAAAAPIDWDDPDDESARQESPRTGHLAVVPPPAKPAAAKPAPAPIAPAADAKPLTPVINIPKTEPRPAAKIGPGSAPARPAGPNGPFPFPDVEKMAYYESVMPDAASLEQKARRIEECLTSFRVDAQVREINPGPAVTQYALEPGAGTAVRRITTLTNDLALALAAPSIRIEAPIPGQSRIGIEIPNDQIATVGLRESIESRSFVASKAKLPIPLGRDVNGRYVTGDLAKMPHLLIAGSTGSGKSVCLNGIISTFLLSRQPADLKMVMVDPKMVEMAGYNGVPHLQCPVITEMDKVVPILRLCVKEMERRYAIFTKLGVRKIDQYAEKCNADRTLAPMPYLVVIVDELADLMMVAPAEVETLLVRLAQKGRASGIHLILATQRPSADVITGLLKANIPARIAFLVTSHLESRVVLDVNGAERLLGRGDMLFMPPDQPKPVRIQGAYVDDHDVEAIVDHWKTVAPEPQFDREWVEIEVETSVEDGYGDEGEDDDLMERAIQIFRESEDRRASASYLQRRLKIGYNRAARVMERLEDEGRVGPPDGPRGRIFLG
jgi:S-DNA-T family DNA segregation ATPase FtsK/SpoIIIE